MTIHSRWHPLVPRCSLQRWLFGSSQDPLGDKKQFLDADRPDTHFVTQAGYRLLAKRVALGLLDAGLQPGDRVLVFSGNNLYYPALFVGVLMAGGVFSGANPSYVARELAFQLTDSGARFLVAAAGSLATAAEAAAQAGVPEERIYVLDDPEDNVAGVAEAEALDGVVPAATKSKMAAAAVPGVHHWLELVGGNRTRALVWDWREPADPETTACCLNYSSGTTGLPKGVEISHRSYVANCSGVAMLFDEGRAADEAAARRARRLELCFLPLYHAFGQTYFVATFPHVGTPVYIMPRFDFVKMLQHVQAFRITALTLVPPIAVALAKHPLARQYDLSSVEDAGCGAAPLARESAAALERLWPAGRVALRQGWGMTELTCTSTCWAETTAPLPGGEGAAAAVGELAPNCAARLVAVDEEESEGASDKDRNPPRYIEKANTPGELWISGPTLLRGYWRNPAATAAAVYVDPADGSRWFKTGDIGYVDRYGPGACFFIVDRRKELIKVRGNQVAPAELEAVLLERPDVADAAVVGVRVRVRRGGPDGGAGDEEEEERPRACVVRVPGTSASAAEIAAWTAKRVAPHKRLTGGVVFVEAIPKNPSGKILRKVLRERFAQEAAKGAAKL